MLEIEIKTGVVVLKSKADLLFQYKFKTFFDFCMIINIKRIK